MRFVVFALLLVVSPLIGAATLWTGPTVSFTKPLNTPTSEQYQDRISERVWITRAVSGGGIYNARVESGYDFDDFSSPAGTEWAFGSTLADGVESLTFLPWADAVGRQPPGYVGVPGVMHLIEEDIYLDVRFTSWHIGSGGGFAYERSSPPVSPPVATQVPLLPGPAAVLLAATIIAAARRFTRT